MSSKLIRKKESLGLRFSEKLQEKEGTTLNHLTVLVNFLLLLLLLALN